MKIKAILSAALFLTLLSPDVSRAQSKAALKGDAYAVSDDNKLWGLEVGGKLVVAKNYTDFSTPDGKYFAVTAQDGKKGICDATGKFIHPCEYVQASVVAGTIMLKTAHDAKPKFYSTANPTAEIQAQKMTIAQLEDDIEARSPGTGFNPVRIKQREAIIQARELSEQTGLLGSYQIRDTDNGKQEIVMNGQVLFTAETFKNIVSVETWPDVNRCWFFIVSDRPGGVQEKYGVLGVGKWIVDEQIKTESLVTIPLEYSFIELQNGSKYWLDCTTRSGGRDRLNLWGKTPDQAREASSKKYEVGMSCPSESRLVIKQVLVGSDFTEIKMEFTQTEESGEFRIEQPKGWGKEYAIMVNGEKLPVKSCTGGLDSYHFKTTVPAGKVLSFGLLFDKLPDGVTKFDLIEGEGGRDFTDITLQ